MKAKPLITVVIPTYSRPDLLLPAVQSVLRQETSFLFDVVVVDDGGSPQARDILKGVDDPRLTVLTQANAGPAAARNRGLASAAGEFVAFMDDDCEAKAGWLEAGVGGFTEGVVMVQGPVAPPKPASPLEYHFIETGMHRHDYSCNMFVRTSAANGVGGFDERYPFAAGEDFDFALRVEKLGEVAFVAAAAITHALLPLKWGKRRRRPELWVSFFRLVALYPERMTPQLLIPGIGPLLLPWVRRFPTVHIMASLATMQFAYIKRDADRTSGRAVAEEIAASVLNVASAARRYRDYADAYSSAQEEREKR